MTTKIQLGFCLIRLQESCLLSTSLICSLKMKHKNPRKSLAFLLIFAFLLLQNPEPSFSQFLHSNPISSQSPTPSPHPKAHTHLRRILLGVLFGSLTGLFVSILFLLFIRLFLLFANLTPILKGPISFSTQISPKTLQLAHANQPESTQLLTSSPSGNYFQITLDNELIVVVKRVEFNIPNASPSQSPNSTRSNSSKRKIQRELELLARVKHRNVMSLRAYIREHDRLFLVYDYIPRGSLEDMMKRVRSGQLSLGWEVRYRIAVGIVKGLRYLHFECSPRILHYGLKPGNVIVEAGFEPTLGDCGLGGLGPARLDTFGCGCYVAPECFQSCRYTDKSDVFSFGVILAVLITGRDPLDPLFSSDSTLGRGGLGRWLRHLQQSGEAREALDKAILGEEVEEEEMIMALRIALVCLSDLPADRPSSDELVAMLTQLHSF